jgi:hypothetical protein
MCTCKKDGCKVSNCLCECHRGSEEDSGYCMVGMDHCVVCGWRGPFLVSSCPECHNSFCS